MSSPFPKIALVGVVAVIVGAVVYFNRPESEADIQATSDAYLMADYSNIAPKVAGTIAKVLVEENQQVETGDLLALIDDNDLRLAVSSAEAALVTIKAQIKQQEALIEQAQATLEADAAAVTLAERDADRARSLVSQKAVSQQALDEAEKDLTTANADQAAAAAALDAARSLRDVYIGQEHVAKVTLDTAKLQLSYAEIRAPISGTIGQQNLRVGDYVSIGTTAMAIVPLKTIYVKANYRETQLARVAPGQAVTMTIDALPDQTFKGHVASIGAASNVSYSSIAPANATGNFTKITQRIPVRIAFEPDQPGMERMRVGMSVVPEINVTH